MRRFFLVILGLVLIGVAGVWFFTPIGQGIVAEYAPSRPAEIAAESSGNGRKLAAPSRAPANMDMLNTVLNALNAVFGAVGIFLTLRGMRARQ